MKRPTAQHGGARMKCNGDSLSLPLSLSLLFMHICAWQSADGRVTYDHCRVTVQWLFSKNFWIVWNVKKTMFDSHPTIAWPPTTVAWPSVTIFKNFPNCLERLKNVVWQSSNGRVTSDHCSVTFSDFFQNFSELLETSKKRCLTVIQRSRDLRPLSRDLQWLFSNFSPNCLKCLKTLFGSHSTVAWPPTTVSWPSVTFFQNFSELLETSKKRCLTVIQRSRDLRPQSRDLRWLFSKFFRIARNV